MKLFHKRPLCLMLCIMLGGFYFSAGTANVGRIIAIGIFLGLLILSFIFPNLLFGRKLLTRICICVALASILLGALWVSLFFPIEHHGNKVDVHANVLSADHYDTSESTLVIRTKTIDGRRDRHTILVRGDKDSLSGINTGDKIDLTVTLSDFSCSGDKTRSTYYIARGYSAIASDPTDAVVLSHGNYTVRYYFDSLRQRLADRFRIITNKDTGDFLAALLTGERDVLDGETELNFLRTATSHILALSGAHLVILAYAITLLLKAFKLNNKVRTVIIAVFVFLYMLLTGMSACVTRAGVMVIVTSAIYLLSHRSDGVTSLAVSTTIIVIFQPYAVFDISLWLSAFATLGLIYLSALNSTVTEDVGVIRRFLRLLINATLASVFAICASFIFCLLSFDSFSPLAVIATLVLSPLTELLIYLGMLGLALGTLIPIGVPIILLTDLVKELTAFMAKPYFALIPFDLFTVQLIGILLVVVFFGFIIFGDPKKLKRAIISLSGLYLVLCLVGIIHITVYRYNDTVVYKSDTRSNIVAVRSDGELGIIASGTGKYTSYYATAIADELKATTLDYYILPSYSYYSIDHIRATVSTIKTKTVYIPTPETSGELVQAEQISALLAEFSTNMKFYSEDEAIEIGAAHYYSVTHSHFDSSITANVFVIRNEDKYITYLSADNLERFNAKVTAAINACDVLVIGGSDGAKYRSLTVSPRDASEIYLGANYAISDEMREFLTRTGTSVEYAASYKYID